MSALHLPPRPIEIPDDEIDVLYEKLAASDLPDTANAVKQGKLERVEQMHAILRVLESWDRAGRTSRGNERIAKHEGLTRLRDELRFAVSEEADYVNVVGSLESSIRRHRRTAFVVGIVGVVLAVSAIWWLHQIFLDDVNTLTSKRGARPYLLAFFIVRGAALTAAVTGGVIGLLTLCRASLDQVTRFEKRLVAARFLHYVMVANKDAISSSNVTLESIREFLKSWNENIESAYTKVKFGRRPPNVSFNVNRGGVAYVEDYGHHSRSVKSHSRDEHLDDDSRSVVQPGSL